MFRTDFSKLTILISAELWWEVTGYTELPLWKDASQPFEKRAADLASRLSFEDMVRNLNSNAPGAITTDGDVLPPISYGERDRRVVICVQSYKRVVNPTQMSGGFCM